MKSKAYITLFESFTQQAKRISDVIDFLKKSSTKTSKTFASVFQDRFNGRWTRQRAPHSRLDEYSRSRVAISCHALFWKLFRVQEFPSLARSVYARQESRSDCLSFG